MKGLGLIVFGTEKWQQKASFESAGQMTEKEESMNQITTNATGVSPSLRPASGPEFMRAAAKPPAVAASTTTPKSVVVCDTQPVTAEGVRTLLAACPDLQAEQPADSLHQAKEILKNHPPCVLMVDKAFGIQPILEWLLDLRSVEGDLTTRTGIVIWGASVTEAEALRFMQAGARGILRKTASISVVTACLRTVAAGRSWMEDCVFGDSSRPDRYPRSELTSREQQVLELVEQGCKNREIALELGIRPGTVKIHLKHIFEKTGVRGRYGLALNGLRDRNAPPVTANSPAVTA
jgi:two-component system, NarL family, nitrate/nitrite response regulator NarL